MTTKTKLAKTDGRYGPRPIVTRKNAKPVMWHKVAHGESPTSQQVKAARLHFNLTQEQAAKLIGYTLNGWQRFEQGERALRPILWQSWLMEARKLKAASATRRVGT